MSNQYSNEELAKAIHLEIESKQITENNRPYLGMSQIGHSCSRYLWYYFRWVKKQSYDARKGRIFSRGHHEEPRLIKMLEGIGGRLVSDQAAVEDCDGHLRGHSDAVFADIPYIEEDILTEFKAVNEKSWKKFQCNKVYETNKQYFAQVQLYMHYTGTSKTLFLVVNKNTEELYIEIIDFDKRIVDKLQRRALDIITSDVPPPRAFDSATYYECNWCDYREICWGNQNYEKNCRTCKYSEPVEQGMWGCKLLDTMLTLETQCVGCDSYQTK